MRCARTQRDYSDPSHGIWDDGEWISWDWINEQLYEQELHAQFPNADPALVDVFELLLDAAVSHKAITGNYLQVWGELGELFAEIKFGVKRHHPMTRGSDGKIGNDYVEVKTISPEKSTHQVHVKRAGNFNKLLVVKIDAHFEFEAELIERAALGKGLGKLARYKWQGRKNTGQ